jgi:hypothetical protein
MKRALEMGSGGMIYIQSFTKTCTGNQAILRFCLSNLNGRRAGINDVRR